MTNKQQIMIDLLKEYARQQGTTVRGTSDLSPLEEWLLLKIAQKLENIPQKGSKNK